MENTTVSSRKKVVFPTQVGILFFYSGLTNTGNYPDEAIVKSQIELMHPQFPKVVNGGFAPLTSHHLTYNGFAESFPGVIDASKEEDEGQIVLKFAERILNDSEDIDPEINKVVRNHFWDLI